MTAAHDGWLVDTLTGEVVRPLRTGRRCQGGRTSTACLRCGKDYGHGRRRPSHFCPPCRVEQRREYERERKRKRRALERELRATADQWSNAGVMGHEHVESALFLTRDDVAHLADPDTHLLPFVIDRPLAGETSSRGPDAGRSTGWADHAGQWDWLTGWQVKEAAGHPWWQDEPHWAYELNNREAAQQYLEAA